MTSTQPASIVRALYKNLLRTARRIPEETKRLQTVSEIKEQFRLGLGKDDPEEQKRLIEKAQSQLGYLKIITPKDSRSSGKSSFVLRDGKLVESTGTSFQRGAIKTGIDPDDIARHNRLMRRQHFMDRKVPATAANLRYCFWKLYRRKGRTERRL